MRGDPFGKRVTPRAPLLNLSLRAISFAFARLRRMKSPLASGSPFSEPDSGSGPQTFLWLRRSNCFHLQNNCRILDKTEALRRALSPSRRPSSRNPNMFGCALRCPQRFYHVLLGNSQLLDLVHVSFINLNGASRCGHVILRG